MSKFLASGIRRDLLVLTYAMDEPRAQELKRALESHYEERVTPNEFHGTMNSLVKSGFVTRSADGVHDRYSLTEGGTRALLDQYEWLKDNLEADG